MNGKLIGAKLRSGYSSHSYPDTEYSRCERRKYKQTVDTSVCNGIMFSSTFFPLAFTTFGAHAKYFDGFLRSMANMAVETEAIDPDTKSLFYTLWRTNILCSLAKVTARYALKAATFHNTPGLGNAL